MTTVRRWLSEVSDLNKVLMVWLKLLGCQLHWSGLRQNHWLKEQAKRWNTNWIDHQKYGSDHWQIGSKCTIQSIDLSYARLQPWCVLFPRCHRIKQSQRYALPSDSWDGARFQPFGSFASLYCWACIGWLGRLKTTHRLSEDQMWLKLLWDAGRDSIALDLNALDNFPHFEQGSELNLSLQTFTIVEGPSFRWFYLPCLEKYDITYTMPFVEAARDLVLLPRRAAGLHTISEFARLLWEPRGQLN